MKRLLIIPFLFISIIISATNYYVKNGGNDNSEGTSDGTAWATLAKINSTSFSPGDTIFFKRGSVWENVTGLNGSINCPSSGTYDNPIVFSAYGTGSKPIFTQAITYDSWTNLAGNLYYKTGVYQGSYLALINGTTWGIRVWSKNTVDSEGEWHISGSNPWGGDNDTIYFYTTTPANLPNTIFASYNTLFAVNTKSYITIEKIEFKYSGGFGCQTAAGSSNIKIDSCKFNYCPIGIMVEGTDTLTLTNNIIINSGGDGMYFSTYANNADISHNNFSVCGVANIGSDGQSIGFWFTHDIYCHDNYFNHTGVGSVIEASSSIASHYWNENINFYNNFFITDFDHTDDVIFSIFSGEFNVYNNIAIFNDSGSGFGFVGISDVGNPTEANIYNNAIINAGYGVGFLVPYGDASGTSDVKVKNNIFYATQYYHLKVSSELYNNFESDYNLYSDDTGSKFIVRTGGNYAYYNFANWKIQSEQDANSLIGNPLFTSEFDDLTLQEGSPAIEAGIGVGLTTDYAGNAWKEVPSIGAYEYDSGSGAGLPSINTVTPTLITAISASSGGNSIDDGGGTVSAKGVCWSTSANPTISGSKISGGTGTDSFTATIPLLKINTTYHVRSYATNSAGTAYGANVSFTTPSIGMIQSEGKSLFYNGKQIKY